jgi:hypothetical protein
VTVTVSAQLAETFPCTLSDWTIAPSRVRENSEAMSIGPLFLGALGNRGLIAFALTGFSLRCGSHDAVLSSVTVTACIV